MANPQDWKSRIDEAKSRHNPRLDSFLYNGGTTLALAFSLAVAAWDWSGGLTWLPRVFGALAAFLIGLERALHFGPRWLYHKKMSASYEALSDRLLIIEDMDGESRDKAMEAWLQDLAALRAAGAQTPMGEGAADIA